MKWDAGLDFFPEFRRKSADPQLKYNFRWNMGWNSRFVDSSPPQTEIAALIHLSKSGFTQWGIEQKKPGEQLIKNW